ncbi:MAG: hypothetical protein ACT4PK_04450, partial [Gammaproteobacteria bacterium]
LACAAGKEFGVQGSLGAVDRHIENDTGFASLDLEYDTGIALQLEGDAAIGHDILLRASYAYIEYDELTAIGGALTIAEDVVQRDLRLGAFWARPTQQWRLGGGYVQMDGRDNFGSTGKGRGPFIEAGIELQAGLRVRFDFAGAILQLRGDLAADGYEARAGVAFGAGTTRFTADARYLVLDRHGAVAGFSFADENLSELRLGIERRWGATGT